MGFIEAAFRNLMGGHHGKRPHDGYGGHGHRGYDAPPPSPKPRRQSGCLKCGALIDLSASFCAQCGAATGPDQCKSCQTALPASSRFCSSCGTAQ
jgi:hypothetical protein